eukprot:g17752.t1
MASEGNPRKRHIQGHPPAPAPPVLTPRTRQLARLPQLALAELAERHFASFTARQVHSFKSDYQLRTALRCYWAWLQREEKHRRPSYGLLGSSRALWAAQWRNLLQNEINRKGRSGYLQRIEQEESQDVYRYGRGHQLAWPKNPQKPGGECPEVDPGVDPEVDPEAAGDALAKAWKDAAANAVRKGKALWKIGQGNDAQLWKPYPYHCPSRLLPPDDDEKSEASALCPRQLFCSPGGLVDFGAGGASSSKVGKSSKSGDGSGDADDALFLGKNSSSSSGLTALRSRLSLERDAEREKEEPAKAKAVTPLTALRNRLSAERDAEREKEQERTEELQDERRFMTGRLTRLSKQLAAAKEKEAQFRAPATVALERQAESLDRKARACREKKRKSGIRARALDEPFSWDYVEAMAAIEGLDDGGLL